MSVKPTYEELERYGRQADITIENLEQKLAESQREFRAADATIENLQMQLDAEREAKLALAAENAGLKQGTPDLQEMMSALDAFFADEEVPERAMLAAYNILRGAVETPATDAFVAGIKADGIEEWVFSRCCSGNDTTDEAIKFADALRNLNGVEA